MGLIQEAADAGRIGGVIRCIVGGKTAFTLESIRDGDETITDGEKVAKTITAFFAKWFARLPEEKDRDKRLAECIINRDRDAWSELATSCGIPTIVSDKLWEAFLPRPISMNSTITSHR